MPQKVVQEQATQLEGHDISLVENADKRSPDLEKSTKTPRQFQRSLLTPKSISQLHITGNEITAKTVDGRWGIGSRMNTD